MQRAGEEDRDAQDSPHGAFSAPCGPVYSIGWLGARDLPVGLYWTG
jgi:hypothetical protein